MRNRVLNIGLCLSVLLLAGNVQAHTVFDAMSKAYDTNPNLRAQRAYLRSVDENVAIAKSGYRPNIYLAGSYTDADNSDNSATYPQHDRQSTSLAAKISQPIFTGFQTVNSVKSADSYIRSEQHNLSNVEQQVLLAAATAYLDVLRDSVIVDLQINNESLLKQRLKETEERFNIGSLTKTDLSQAKARYSRSQSDRIAAEGILEASKANYVRIIGTLPQELQEPYEIVKILPSSNQEAIEYALDQNFSVRQAKEVVNSKYYDTKAEKGSLLPKVTLDAAATKTKYEMRGLPKDGEVDSLEWSVNVTVPLYQAGAERAKIRQAKYQKWQAIELADVAKRQVVSDVTSSWEYLLTNQSRVKAIASQINANEVALEGVKKEEAVGNRTALDVLDAYQELLNSKVDEEKARRDYYISAMQLLLSMGKLTAQDLGLKVELYDAKEKYKETRDKWLSTGISRN